MEISKNSKFYISPEEMVAEFKDRRNINILCFNRVMTLMVEYPNRAGHNCMNYYFSAIFKEVAKIDNGLLLCTYEFGFKNKKGAVSDINHYQTPLFKYIIYLILHFVKYFFGINLKFLYLDNS